MRRITSFLIAGIAVVIAGCGGGGGSDGGSGGGITPPGGFASGHYKGTYDEAATPLSGGVPVPGGKGWLGNTKGAIDITVTNSIVTGTFTPTGGTAATVSGTIDSSGNAVILVMSVKPTAEIYGNLLHPATNEWGGVLGESDGNPETGHFSGNIGIDLLKQ